jgi:hypothetical protein
VKGYGQYLINLEIDDRGVESLLKAYMLDGEQIFAADDDGEQYLQMLQNRKLIN